jgi:broad specificity phosphatase PhoE
MWGIALVALLLPILVTAQSTTVILVRHSERADSQERPQTDPELSEAGKVRAAKLAEFLKDAGVAAIYSTQYIRTRTSAEPVAKMAGVQVTVLPFAGGNSLIPYTDSLATRILRDHRGKTVLVVGHNTTTAQMVKALGGPLLPAIPETDFDNMYVVQVAPDGKASFIRAKF